MPEALNRRPDVGDRDAFYWNAFQELHRRRALGEGVLPLQFGAIGDYLDILGWDDVEARLNFTTVVCAIDDVWVDHARGILLKPEDVGKSEGSTNGNSPGNHRRRTRQIGRK